MFINELFQNSFKKYLECSIQTYLSFIVKKILYFKISKLNHLAEKK